MEVHLTPDQDALIRVAIEDGRLHRKEDAVREAMSLWEERERRRMEILVAADLAEASLARGEGRNVLPPGRTPPMSEFRLARAEYSHPRPSL